VKRHVMAAVAFALGLPVAGPAWSQSGAGDTAAAERPFRRDCHDEYGRNLCDRDLWSGIVASFDLAPAEAVQAAGYRGVRVFLVDGYSNDLPVVSILARSFDRWGRPTDATLEVRGSRGAGRIEGSPPLSRHTWEQLSRMAQDLQARIVSSPIWDPSQSDTVVVTLNGEEVICIHAWMTVVESLSQDGVQRRIRSSCSDDPIFEAAIAVSAQVLRGFPHCNHLEPDHYRNEVEQLQRCLDLQGTDLIAAAEVMNILDGPVFDDLDSLADFVEPEAHLVSADGTQSSLDQAIGTSATGHTNLNIACAEGSPGRVVADGTLERSQGDDVLAAATQLVWIRVGGNWRVSEVTIAAWQSIYSPSPEQF
jgi:hypothetical protein